MSGSFSFENNEVMTGNFDANSVPPKATPVLYYPLACKVKKNCRHCKKFGSISSRSRYHFILVMQEKMESAEGF